MKSETRKFSKNFPSDSDVQTSLRPTGKSHGKKSLVGYSPWGRREPDMTERLHFDFSLSCIGEGNGNTPVFLPGETQGWRSLVGCSP